MLRFIYSIMGLLSVMSVAKAADLEVLVAPRGSEAYGTAESMADGTAVMAERRIHNAFRAASARLAECGGCTVTIRIAGGTYTGRADAGLWQFPDTMAPEGRLEILGGWDAAFEVREPFNTPTILQVAKDRSGPVLKFEGRKITIGEVTVSGLVIDAGPSNNYDRETNSLTKAGSSTWGLLAFGNLATNRLTIADNVFMNAAEGVGGPLIRALSSDAEVHVRNNLFFNNVRAWIVPSGASSTIPKRYVVEGNSFVLNWPFNPDPTTSNPGTLEIGNNYAAEMVEITGNLFAYNVGGAIHPQWDDDRGPDLVIQDNLFFKNGQLFGATESGDGAVVGKFAGSATYRTFDPIDLEDDFTWDVSGNVDMNPELAVKAPALRSVRYGAGYRGANPPGGGESPSETDSDLDAAAEELGIDLSAFEAELAGMVETGDDEETKGAEEDPMAEESAEPELDLMGSDGRIKNYAPNIPFSLDILAFPSAPDAQAYGASPDRVTQP